MMIGGLVFLNIQTAEAQQTEPKKEVAKPTQTEQPSQTATAAGPGFVDADGDGICDNYNGSQPGKGLGPCNGQGQTVQNVNCPRYGQAVQNGRGKGVMRGNGQGIKARDGSGPRCNMQAGQ